MKNPRGHDLCPCGSGIKYKKCCKDKNTSTSGTTKPINDEQISSNFQIPNNIQIFSTNMGISTEQFDTKEDILNDIRKRGYYPAISEETDFEENSFDDETWISPPRMEIWLACKHGYAEEAETYELQENGKWECIESGGGIEFCFFCEKGIIPTCQNCKTPLPELYEKQIIELWKSKNHILDLKCPNCGKSTVEIWNGHTCGMPYYES